MNIMVVTVLWKLCALKSRIHVLESSLYNGYGVMSVSIISTMNIVNLKT